MRGSANPLYGSPNRPGVKNPKRSASVVDRQAQVIEHVYVLDGDISERFDHLSFDQLADVWGWRALVMAHNMINCSGHTSESSESIQRWSTKDAELLSQQAVAWITENPDAVQKSGIDALDLTH